MRRIAVALSAVAALALVVASWILPRYLGRRRDKKTQEAVLECTRAEEEVQDALLQNFQGVLLKFHAANALVIERPEDAHSRFNDALAEADQAIAEARDAIQDLRPPAQDLAGDLLQLGKELGADPADDDAPMLCVEVRGHSRDLSTLVYDEVYRVAREAVRIAISASRSDHVEVDIHYGARQFQLHARTSGRSRNAALLRADTEPNLYRHLTVREPVRLAGGQLTIRSCTGGGTKIELSIPASVAYVASR